jgi:hypothetical protein
VAVSSKIALARIQANRIAGAIIKSKGNNAFLGVNGSLNFGVRPDFDETVDGLVRKDSKLLLAP